MSDFLWQKTGVQTDARIMRFLAGDDVLLDREFLLFDIEASKAHVEGLVRIGLLADAEGSKLLRELDALARDFSAG
ncbi:MAG: argininosuccinate lyase, partial [Dokdonella sp.]